jgi:hypothetical protein
MASIPPKPGFNWSAIAWGGPDEPASDHCSYCGDEIPEDSVPLILWNAAGWCTPFCDHCRTVWWAWKPSMTRSSRAMSPRSGPPPENQCKSCQKAAVIAEPREGSPAAPRRR